MVVDLQLEVPTRQWGLSMYKWPVVSFLNALAIMNFLLILCAGSYVAQPEHEVMVSLASSAASMRLMQNISKTECSTTKSYSVLLTTPEVIIQSYDKQGLKNVGGDEMYATLTHTSKSRALLAVGHVTDLTNGQYKLTFQALQGGKRDVTIGDSLYKLNMVLQYSCGDGFLPPPLKAKWKSGGQLSVSVPVTLLENGTVHVIEEPPMPTSIST